MPVQLHVELAVDPARERDLVEAYQTFFQPAIQRQAGFVEVKLLKHRATTVGEGRPEASYRLLISFHTEEQRQAWVASDDHQRAWPKIGNLIDGAKLRAELYDIV